MSSESATDWPRLIRKNIYQLSALYVVLAVLAIGYNTWQGISSDALLTRANDYHLASDNHLLRAIKEIRLIEYHDLYYSVESSAGGRQLPPHLKAETTFRKATALHLLRQSIHRVLALQEEFGDSAFDALSGRVEQWLLLVDQAIDRQASNGGIGPAGAVAWAELLTPLMQIERLHSVERDRILARLDVMQQRQNQVFVFLVAFILVTGTLSMVRALRTIHMITAAQIRAQRQIRIFSAAIEQSPISVILTDTEANVVYVNHHFQKITGYGADELLGRNLDFLHAGIRTSEAYKDIWALLARGETASCELESHNNYGQSLTEKVYFSPVLNEEGDTSHYLLVKEDITAHKQQEEQILYQAHYDSLTELPNRFLALDRLSQHLNEARRKKEKVALLFLDLDDFKKVNDSLGHETGDKLLIEAARRLLDVVRSGDTVGRLGGDEFIVLLSGLSDSADALPVADNLINQFREAFRIDGRELILTASIGIAVYPDDGDSSSDLLRNADSAMYNAKSQGRNTYAFYTEHMNQAISRRLALEEQMHGALERGEFHLLYQPKVHVQTGEIIGAEALLRWNNPVLEAVYPDEFIPIAEQTGFIVPMGEFVFAEALQTAAGWMRQYDRELRIAVNLSPRQFRDPKLVQFIQNTIDRCQIASHCLELEITEGVLMSGHAYIDEALSDLQKLGVELAMDDFGKGYSSLSYLRTYPFTTLKIDRDFVEDILDNPSDRELVNATIAMAHGLGLKVVAEGVETEGQLQYLRERGCEYAQGYLLGRPVSAAEFSRSLERQHTPEVVTGH